LGFASWGSSERVARISAGPTARERKIEDRESKNRCPSGKRLRPCPGADDCTWCAQRNAHAKDRTQPGRHRQ
jgi:hypothetical protein